MIPDLLSRGRWFTCIRQLMKDLQAEQGRGVTDLLAARAWLVAQAEVDARQTVVLGLCMGGGFALLLAKTGLFQVAAPFYGHVPVSLKGSCPIVASYGECDEVFKLHYVRLKAEVKREKIPADLKLYPQVGHSFMNQAPSRGLQLIGGLLPMHTGHHPATEEHARQRVVAFIRKHIS
jgi:carboxymethylenebutenolidase